MSKLSQKPSRKGGAPSCTLLSLSPSLLRFGPPAVRRLQRSLAGAFSPECHYDGWRLGAGCDEGNYEQEDQEGDEGVAGAFALPGHSVAVLIEIGFHDDHTELAALAHRGRGDHLSALDAGALCIIANLRSKQ